MLPGSVEDNLKAGFVCALGSRGQLPRGRAEALLEQLGLSTQQLQQQAATLSGGEAARIALIRGLLIEPEVLLADELLAHLDSEVAEAVASLLERWLQQAAGRALIFVGHEEAPWRLIPHRRVTLERGDGP